MLANLQVSAARAHAQMGEHERATTLAHAALAVTADQTEEMHICAQSDALYVLGLTAYAAGRVDEAVERQLRGLALRETLGNTSGDAGVLPRSRHHLLVARAADQSRQPHWRT